MHLKKLEITGFKSFANKIVLEFNRQVTAVVGPNGSGKSNIADAMRWVLGEQGLRSLRLKSSEDVIFAGSNEKARLGAAQVFLYLDNSAEKLKDFPEEVILGRKYFRNGESEYSINNKQARLKDVTHVAAQVGVGTKSYAIVTQGMADAILSASPKDRRAIFEEAAGVKLFQLKKEETLRKLESTKTNVTRVEDLLREILPHLKFLERQAKKAEKRQGLEKELREKQSQFYSFKLNFLEKKLKDINDEENSLNEKIARTTKELQHAQQELAKENTQTIEKDKEEIELEKTLNTLQDSRNELTREIALLEGKIEMLAKYRPLAPSFVKHEMPHGARTIELGSVAAQVQEIFSAYQALEKKILAAKTIEELSFLREQCTQLGAKIKKLHQEFHSPIAQEKESAKKVERAQEKNLQEENTQELETLRAQKKTLQHALDKVQHDIESVRNNFQKIKEQERINRKKFFDLERQVRFQEDQILLAENKIKDLTLQEERVTLERQEIMNEIKEHEIELVDAREQVNDAKLEVEIYRLRRQLEEIGGIDELVLQEYKETNERYTFLVKEKEDLEKAAKDLREAIGVLNYKINHQFNEKFKEINEEFNKYFKMIFGGGKAFLKKVKEPTKKQEGEEDSEPGEEENSEGDNASDQESEMIDDGGIDIRVNLPNKKIENINVMSGGERALTSIAVLFAIIGANPPPFCVLDEVDAALDDANAFRFSKILEELSSRAQFVLITHNRETMRAAKVLYGVTMEEEGISKLVSVKIEG